jgi:Phosphodiester glycosidase/WD40-like Beta Propeller Repeat
LAACTGAPAVRVPRDAVSRGWILSARPDSSSMDLWALPAGGGPAVRITATPDADEHDPEWSPNGDRIVFARRPRASTSADIWVIGRSGTSNLHLTRDLSGPDDRQPAWSPDGRSIVWTRGLDQPSLSEIWIMRADGSGARPLVESIPGTYRSSPAWSPTGDWIAFVSERPGRFPDIFTVRPDGSDLTRLTRGSGAETTPAWSPNGARLAFQRMSADGVSDVWTMDTDGSHMNRVTTEGNAASPVWSPDGRMLAYVVYTASGGGRTVHVVPADGSGDPKPLPAGGPEASLDWGPNGPPPRLASLPASRTGEVPGRVPTESGGGAAGDLSFRRLRFMKTNIFVLRVGLGGRFSIDVALAGDEVSERATTSSIVSRHGAVAGINGDFPLASGKPVHPLAEDGELKTTSEVPSRNFAISSDGREAYIGRPVETLAVDVLGPGGSWRFDQMNSGAPGANEIAAYTEAGSQHGDPPSHACSARLVQAGPDRWASVRQGLSHRYIVAVAGCGIRPLQLQGGVVLSARVGTAEALFVSSLRPGEPVNLTWSLGWTSVVESIGGFPLLVRDGQVEEFICDPFLCLPLHPRTGVGVTTRGHILLVVADGRQETSRGITLEQFARLFVKLGAVAALNLDGGASSTMVFRSRVVNEPSYGEERGVSSALLVISGSDPDERLLSQT